ncbi:MAG TPA: flagellar basal body P-ring protein FlgI [Vicinamibacterales bacterium]|nr:flagellar basal body P-ring protein FlgI [Vicinamibacterales bacterium]
MTRTSLLLVVFALAGAPALAQPPPRPQPVTAQPQPQPPPQQPQAVTPDSTLKTPTPTASSPAAAMSIPVSRLKDIVSLQGPMIQPVVGYGLVVGLNKTGDRRQTVFSAQTLANMLERFGVAVPAGGIKIENVAAVLVTAEIGPYAQTGARIDVTASSIGDARSLQGGTLLPTPLRGPDGSIIALAQGSLSIGGFSAGGGGNTVAVNHLTVGRVPGGALVQVTRQTALPDMDVLRLSLHEPDFVSAGRVAKAINMELGASSAHVSDPGTIVLQVPKEYRSSIADLVARIEPLSIAVDTTARVVINERTGTVVLGGDVQIGPAAVAHGNLSVRIATQYQVSQPQGFSRGETAVTPQTQVNVEQEDRKLVTLEAGTTLADVVRALNTLGVTPRDIIAIMQALKAAGALRAEVVIL